MRPVLVACLLVASTSSAFAQEDGWVWSGDANVFFGYNYQRREFRDFSAWESQNWVMAGAERRSAHDRLRLGAMLSFEAFTLQDIGSPQVFQTGETFRGAPLVDYQHPHDLFMRLGGDYQRTVGRARVALGGDLVGSPTLGPAPFMHRPSAIENPQAPLSHHYMDSSHITHGVVRGGVGAGPWMLEGSWFQGQEPDENRTDLDLAALDSYALRVSWIRGRWSAQVSGARLTQPERVTPFDARKITASIGREANGDTRGISWLAAFGQKREVHGNFEAYLLEATIRASATNIVYSRIESVAKDILDVGFHPTVFHQHRQSPVQAFTLGYVRNLLQSPAGAIGIGGDVTAYRVAANLREGYGSPLSFHVFLRYRAPARRTGTTHVH
jgi:hypothetical protein